MRLPLRDSFRREISAEKWHNSDMNSCEALWWMVLCCMISFASIAVLLHDTVVEVFT